MVTRLNRTCSRRWSRTLAGSAGIIARADVSPPLIVTRLAGASGFHCRKETGRRLTACNRDSLSPQSFCLLVALEGAFAIEPFSNHDPNGVGRSTANLPSSLERALGQSVLKPSGDLHYVSDDGEHQALPAAAAHEYMRHGPARTASGEFHFHALQFPRSASQSKSIYSETSSRRFWLCRAIVSFILPSISFRMDMTELAFKESHNNHFD